MSKKTITSYCFSFKETGVKEIDDILELICRAGKAYLSTEYWDDPIEGDNSYIEKIQMAAEVAAKKIRKGDD